MHGARPVTPGLCCAIGVALLLVYSLNGRSIGSGDTAPATLLAVAMARGDGVVLDRWAPTIAAGGVLPYWATVRRGHIVSCYPVAPAVLAVPATWLQLRLLDAVWPEWTRWELPVTFLVGKNSAAALAALFGVVTFVLLARLGYGRERWIVLVAATLGSEMWVVGSQSLWQHGPAALALAVGILAAAGPPTGRRALVVGLASGAVFACRIVSSIYVVPLVAWMLLRRPRTLGWVLLGALPLVGLTLAYNLYWFDGWQGGIVVLEAMKQRTHAVSGRWSADVAGGLAGTLLSPARGLFVYMPWVAVALLLRPFTRRRTPTAPLETMLVVSLAPSALVLGAYSTWWAGWSFGPRFWTDASPIFAVLLASALTGPWRHPRLVGLGLSVAVAAGVVIQAVGAACYPSSWNGHPVNVDHAHARLWSWSDSELTRCLAEGPHPASYRPRTPAALESALGVARRPGADARRVNP